MTQASGDADLTIVTKALESSKSYTTVLNADEFDILALLCSKASEWSHLICLQPLHNIRTKTGIRVHKWQVQHTQRVLGDISNILLVICGFSGRDTMSRQFGLWEKVFFKIS